MFTLFYGLWNLSCSDCNTISLYFLCCPVHGSVCLVCGVFDSVGELFGEQFAIVLGVIAILLLIVMEVLSVGGGDLLDRPCIVFQ